MTKLLLFACLVLSACRRGNGSGAPSFSDLPEPHTLQPQINEVSGLADSKENPGYLWAHQDSGQPPELFLVGHDGRVARKVYLSGIQNRDWEDMALCGGKIYLAETGDNALKFTDYFIYSFAEPSGTTDTVRVIETIRFSYPDGPHDCEAILVDPVTHHIYLITKNDFNAQVYRLNYPFGVSNTANLLGSLPYTGVVAASLSQDGSELLMKTYSSVFYYTVPSLEQAIFGKYVQLPYQIEQQGEAISLAADGSGYFTLSEKAFAPSVSLNFYRRKN